MENNTKYYVDNAGNYLGGFDGAEPPEGSIEIEYPPIHGWQKWDGENWGELETPDKTPR